jgi:hypothetical protein
MGTVAIGGVIGFVLWCIFALYLHHTSIHPKKISQGKVILAGVHPGFIEALEQHRQSPNRQQGLALEGLSSVRGAVRLMRMELPDGLPAICLYCGESAAHWTERTFKEQKDMGGGASTVLGIASLLVLGVGWVTTGTSRTDVQRLRAPFCGRHRHHWLMRSLALAAFVALMVGGPLLLLFAIPKEHAGWGCLAILFCGIGGFAGASVAHETSIQAVGVNQDSVTLKNVSMKFIQVVKEKRRPNKSRP